MSIQFPWGARPDFKNVVRIKMTDHKLVAALQKRWAEIDKAIWAGSSDQTNKLLNICEEMVNELDARNLTGWEHVVDRHYTCSQQFRTAINAMRNMKPTVNVSI